MKEMKFGVLGVSGHFLKRIVLPLQKSNTVKIHSIGSRNLGKAMETAVKYDIPKYFGSYEEVLEDNEIDAVFIPLPNHLHKEWIFKCLDAGKHVLCEKPLAMNADEVLEIMDRTKNSGLSVMEAFMVRFHPKWHKAKSFVDNGYIGKVTQIHSVFSYNNQDSLNIRNIKSTGGGALLDIGCYAINTARYIMGRAPDRALGLINEHPDFHTDMLTSAMLDFGDARALFTTGTATFPQQEVKVFGTEGSVTITIPFNDISEIPGKIIFENNEAKREIEVPPVNQYRLMFEDFAKTIQENKKPLVTLADSLENMKTIDAVFKSAQSGKWEQV